MLVIQPIGARYVFLIPAIAARLVTADQQDGGAPRVEGEENPVRAARPALGRILPVIRPWLQHLPVPQNRDRSTILQTDPYTRRPIAHEDYNSKGIWRQCPMFDTPASGMMAPAPEEVIWPTCCSPDARCRPGRRGACLPTIGSRSSRPTPAPTGAFSPRSCSCR